MENLHDYGLTLVVINDSLHLYDLISNEIYEEMSLSYIEQLLFKWNKIGKCLYNYGIIMLAI